MALLTRAQRHAAQELEAAAKGDNLFEQDLKWLNEARARCLHNAHARAHPPPRAHALFPAPRPLLTRTLLAHRPHHSRWAPPPTRCA